MKTDLKFDGKNLVPLIRGNAEGFKDRSVIVNAQLIAYSEVWSRNSFMKNKWRIVNGNELYDLKTDPEQRTHVAEQFPDMIQQFKKEYDEWGNEILPTYSDEPRIIIGHESANPITLCCHGWLTDIVL